MPNRRIPQCSSEYSNASPYKTPAYINTVVLLYVALCLLALCLLYFHTIPNGKYIKLLHFAPERCLTDFFLSLKKIDYLSVDLSSNLAMKKEDITSLSFRDNIFDIIICVHVLEHIEDDTRAIRELFRVIKPGGFAIIQVPIDFKRNKTFEDFSISSPEDRLKFFGQDNHVRVCGIDYHDRLKKSGFEVNIIKPIEFLGRSKVEKYAISESDFVYLCQKSIYHSLIEKIASLKRNLHQTL